MISRRSLCHSITALALLGPLARIPRIREDPEADIIEALEAAAELLDNPDPPPTITCPFCHVHFSALWTYERGTISKPWKGKPFIELWACARCTGLFPLIGGQPCDSHELRYHFDLLAQVAYFRTRSPIHNRTLCCAIPQPFDLDERLAEALHDAHLP
ncbi:hypothetical protein KKF61_07720 [Patescibacteria group bacterium]|nr:hypothetical protein [Patescibacteria group bacterium]